MAIAWRKLVVLGMADIPVRGLLLCFSFHRPPEASTGLVRHGPASFGPACLKSVEAYYVLQNVISFRRGNFETPRIHTFYQRLANCPPCVVLSIYFRYGAFGCSSDRRGRADRSLTLYCSVKYTRESVSFTEYLY